MYRISLSFVLLFLSCLSFGQTAINSCDSLLKKAIQKQIGFPYSNNTVDSSGVTLIKVLKKADSLYIDIIYASSNRYNLTSDKGIRHRLNKYTETFPNQYLAYVPIYFDFYLEGEHKIPLNKQLEAELEQKIKKLSDNAHVLKPIMIDGYQTVH